MSSWERVRLWLNRDLRVELSGWRRGAYFTASLYFWLWLVAIGATPLPSGVVVATGVLAVLAGGVVALIVFGPAPLAAPVARRHEPDMQPKTRERKTVLVLSAMTVIGGLLAFLLDRQFAVLAVLSAYALAQHLWETSSWGHLHRQLGPDRALLPSIWKDRRERRLSSDRARSTPANVAARDELDRRR